MSDDVEDVVGHEDNDNSLRGLADDVGKVCQAMCLYNAVT